ncbi:MAG: tetratricopeptide repeat protein [Spirochaetota bacterium]
MAINPILNRKELEEHYNKNLPLYEGALHQLLENVKDILSGIPVYPTFKGRVKSFKSYYKKYLKKLRQSKTPEKVIITDLIGIRIVCPFLEDVRKVNAVIKKSLDIVESEQKGEPYSSDFFGYESTHFLVKNPVTSPQLENQPLVPFPSVCEIQVRTILQDAWSEIEHELVYKVDFTPFAPPLKRKLAALNANLTLSDIIFQEIRDYQRQLHVELKRRRRSFIHQVERISDTLMAEKAGRILPRPNGPARDDGKLKDNNGEYATDIDKLLLEALLAHNKRRFKEAIKLYSGIIENSTEERVKTIVLTHRGMAYFAESEYDNALKDFLFALEIDSGNFNACYYCAVVYNILGNYPASLDYYNKSLIIDPYNFDALFGRAKVFFHLGDTEKSLKDSEEALRIEPDSVPVRNFFKVVQAVILDRQ